MRNQYIVMPVEGWTSDRMFDFYSGEPIPGILRRSQAEVTSAGASVGVGLASVIAATPLALAAMPDPTYDVLASSHENGPKLCALPKETVRLLRALAPTASLEPNRKVYAAVRRAARVRPAPEWMGAADHRRVRFRVVDEDGQAIPGARVIAYADPVLPLGASRRTRRNGVAVVPAAADTEVFPRVTIEPPPGYVAIQLEAVSAAAGQVTVQLRKVDPATEADALGRWRVGLPAHAGQGVRIGVVDTGVNPAHPDLAHAHTASVYAFDDGTGAPHPHANHVAGLIGARGPIFRGLAPEAELYSYRVTALGQKDTSSYFLGDGIEKAALNEDLHLINVSMTQKASSAYLAKAAVAAYTNGAVCIGAAGNDGRDVVSYPAAAKRFIAVSAYCDSGALAADAPGRKDISDVASATEAGLSRAKFSNWGSEVDFIAPGVAIISCQGASGYAADSGTSFAAPIVTGLAAVMLSKEFPHILAMPKDSKRAAAITQALLTRGRDLGFKFETQGNGILNV